MNLKVQLTTISLYNQAVGISKKLIKDYKTVSLLPSYRHLTSIFNKAKFILTIIPNRYILEYKHVITL
jgi:hypothetical protein